MLQCLCIELFVLCECVCVRSADIYGETQQNTTAHWGEISEKEKTSKGDGTAKKPPKNRKQVTISL